MLKGLCTAFLLIAAFFMVPSVAWSEPESSSFPVLSTLLPYEFPVRAGLPNANNLLNEANKTRQSAGLAPLRASEKLSFIAEQRVADMAKRQYYSHKNPEGNYYHQLMQDYGMDPEYSCENLDLVFVYSDNGIIDDWLHSPKGHRDCLLNKEVYETGIAIAAYSTAVIEGRQTTIYVVASIHSTGL